MKLWLVITFFHQVVGVAGPLPYDMTECKDRAAQFEAAADQSEREGKKLPPFRGREMTRGDIKFTCVEAAERPAMGQDL